MPSANTFKYRLLNAYTEVEWAMPVYPSLRDMQFKDDLQVGDTGQTRYRSNPIFARTLVLTADYTPQYYVEGERVLLDRKQKEATVRIRSRRCFTRTSVTESYGASSQTRSGKKSKATRSTPLISARTTIDDGISAAPPERSLDRHQHIADIPVLAMEIYRGRMSYTNRTSASVKCRTTVRRPSRVSCLPGCPSCEKYMMPASRRREIQAQ